MFFLGSKASALLAVVASAAGQEHQTSTLDRAAFLSEASALVSCYVPSAAYSQLTASVAVAAAASSITGNPGSLFFSAVIASQPPAWFEAAVPPPYSSNIAALEGAIADLRVLATPTATSRESSISQTPSIVVATTTNSLGSTVTTSFTPTSSTALLKSSTSSGLAVPTAAVGRLLGAAGIAALAAAAAGF